MKCFIFLLLAPLVGCGATWHIQTDLRVESASHTRHVALFLDGTANDLATETNVARLNHIVRNQDIPNLHVFYNEGVGTGLRWVGAGTGWGVKEDVAEAYAFLTRFYRPGSKLYIFGFSRGAYTSRILAGMIYSVGIYDLTELSEKDRLKVAKKLYDAYKSEADEACNVFPEKVSAGMSVDCHADKAKDIARIRRKATKIIRSYDLEERQPMMAEIDLLGLWDTVEALGFVQTNQAILRNLFGVEEDINVSYPNHRYIDQVCNVKRALHAVALDDNRAYVFTPIALRNPHLIRRCPEKGLDHVSEVWFSGAHADVGGGYRVTDQSSGSQEYLDTSLSGHSLNWMIAEIRTDSSLRDLLQTPVQVVANVQGFAHDAENSSSLYQREWRHEVMNKYCSEVYGVSVSKSGQTETRECIDNGAFYMHESALRRLERIRISKAGMDSAWYRKEPFSACFDENNSGYILRKDCAVIRRVENPPLKKSE